TAELDANGHVTTTNGSWRAGVDGAKPGIFMPAQPRPGASFRQEYYKGQAEDHFQVVGVAASQILLTKEWTPLEPARPQALRPGSRHGARAERQGPDRAGRTCSGT